MMHQYPGLQPALRLVAICSAFAAFGTVLASSPAMADAKLFALEGSMEMSRRNPESWSNFLPITMRRTQMKERG